MVFFHLCVQGTGYPKILHPQIKFLDHQELKDRWTTRPLLEEASMTVPPPATIPTWPLTTMMSPARRSEKRLMRVYLPTLRQPEEVM